MPRLHFDKRSNHSNYHMFNLDNGERIIITKQETIQAVQVYIKQQLDDFAKETISEEKDLIQKELEKSIWLMETKLKSFIDERFDTLAERVVEMLMMRKFNEEVDKKVAEKLKNRGKF